MPRAQSLGLSSKPHCFMPGRDPVMNWSMRIGNPHTGEDILVDHATSEHRCWLNALVEVDEYLSEKA